VLDVKDSHIVLLSIQYPVFTDAQIYEVAHCPIGQEVTQVLTVELVLYIEVVKILHKLFEVSQQVVLGQFEQLDWHTKSVLELSLIFELESVSVQEAFEALQ